MKAVANAWKLSRFQEGDYTRPKLNRPLKSQPVALLTKIEDLIDELQLIIKIQKEQSRAFADFQNCITAPSAVVSAPRTGELNDIAQKKQDTGSDDNEWTWKSYERLISTVNAILLELERFRVAAQHAEKNVSLLSNSPNETGLTAQAHDTRALKLRQEKWLRALQNVLITEKKRRQARSMRLFAVITTIFVRFPSQTRGKYN
jgi:hypothetical protein